MRDRAPGRRRQSSSDRRGRVAAVGVGVGVAVAGVALAVWPDVSLTVFSRFAGWAMVLVGSVRAIELLGRDRLRSWALVSSIASVGLGVALLVWPGRTVLAATLLAGVWLVINGMARVLDTVSSSSVRGEVIGNALGCLEALLGVLVLARPVAGVRAAAILLGAGMVVQGLARMRDGIRSAA